MKQSKRFNESNVGSPVTSFVSRGPLRALSQSETDLEQRRIWFLVLILLVLGALVLSSNRALAGAPSCFATHGVNPEKAKQSLQARQIILADIEARLMAISSTQRGMLKKVTQEIFHMEDLSLKQNKKVVGGIKLDFLKLPQTPDIDEHTLQVLNFAYTLDLTPEQFAHWSERAHMVIQKDPYFNWLQLHQVLDSPGFPGDSDVRDYFVALVEDFPQGQRLTPELAFLQVYRDADPRATPEQIQRIDDILRMQMAVSTLLEDRRILKLTDGEAGPPNAWGLASNLSETQRNLDVLLQQQVQLHSARFPRKSFELASQLTMPMYSSRELLSSEKIFGKLMRPQPNDPADVGALKTYLDLPSDFPEDDLRRVMRVLHKMNWSSRGGSYEIFLLNAFEDPSSLNAKRTRSLLTLIEFMEATKSLGGNEKLWSDMLESRVHRFYGP